MPSTRSLALGGGAAVLVGLQGLAAAQAPNAADEIGLGAGLLIEFLVSLVVYLLLGGALVTFGPRYATARVSDVREDPGGAFGWGLVVGIAVPIVLVILALTIIGLIVAVPGVLVLFVLGVVGNAVTVVWIGAELADTGGDVDGYAVGVGALALAVVSAIPLLGGFLTTVIGLFGLGAVSRDAYQSRGSGSGPGSGRKTRPKRKAVSRRDDL